MKSKSTQLILLVTVLLIVAVLVLSYFTYKSTKEWELNESFRNLNTIVEQASLSFEEYVNDQARTLENLRAFLYSVEDLEAARNSIIRFYGSSTDEKLEGVVFFGKTGTIEISTMPGTASENYSDSEFWRKITDLSLRDKVSVSDLKESIPARSPEEQEFKVGVKMILAAPLYKQGRSPVSQDSLEGAIAYFINLDRILDKQLAAVTGSGQFKMWIVDARGHLLYHSGHSEMETNHILRPAPDCFRCHENFSIVERAMAGVSDHVLRTMKDGSRELVSFFPVRLKDNLLSIAVTTPYEAVLSKYQQSLIHLFLFSSGLILLILASAVLLYQTNKKRVRAEEEARHIMEKLRLEEGLRESEERYRNMIERSNDAIWVLDRDGKFQEVNNRFEAATGYRKKEIQGRDFRAIVLNESAVAYEKAIADAMKGSAETVEITLLHKYLKPLILSVNLSAVVSSGAVIGTVNFGRDVTLKKTFEQELLKRNKELSALHEIASSDDLLLAPETLSKRVLNIIIDALNADGGTIFLRKKSNEQLMDPVCAAGVGDEREFMDSLGSFHIGEGLIGTIALIEDTLAAEDITEETRLSRPGILKEGFRGFAGAPLKMQGKVVGVLVIYFRRSHRFSEEETEFFAILANETGLALGNTLLLDETVRKSERIEAFAEIDRTILSSLSTRKILEQIVLHCKKIIPCDRVSVVRYDPENNDFTLLTVQTDRETRIQANRKYAFEETGLSDVIMTGQTVYRADCSDLRYLNDNEFLKEDIRSVLLVPLKMQNRILGTLNFGSSLVNGFSRDEISAAETLAYHLSIAMSNAELYENTLRSKREWQNTFDSISDLICIHDENGSIIKVNRTFFTKLGVGPNEIIGKKCDEIMPGRDRSGSFCPDMAMLRNGRMLITETEIAEFNGTYEIASVPLLDDGLNAKGIIHIFRDITESKRLKEDLVQSEKLSALGQLVSGVAHELNNPLTGVMGYAQLLLSNELDEQQKNYVGKILRESERAAKIIQNLLVFARKTKAEKKPTSINDIIERTIELRAYNLRVGNIQIVKNLGSDLPLTVVDEQQMQQVFLNILVNAEQAMAAANRTGAITISTEMLNGSEKKRIKVEFRDEGPGIPEEHLPKIFDPFFTTKEVGKGTGLGLSISLGLVQDHGGSITARNYQNGAILSVELPVAAEKAQ